ncbi:hypothetical protein EDC04DRAFT_2702267 [Pisolithus marmoratus]|nr:hypothetical protein EDC04DRAFT_2702267 [Pisolithus marmoratus]
MRNASDLYRLRGAHVVIALLACSCLPATPVMSDMGSGRLRVRKLIWRLIADTFGGKAAMKIVPDTAEMYIIWMVLHGGTANMAGPGLFSTGNNVGC